MITLLLAAMFAPLIDVGRDAGQRAGASDVQMRMTPSLPAARARSVHKGARSPVKRPQARIDAANRAASEEPATQGFRKAIQVYPFQEGALYRLYAAPGRITDIALEPGETIIAVAAGDTARWTIGDTSSGAGENRRVHILIKPFSAGLRTNLVITTDRRVYHLQLESTAATAMTGISWSYGASEVLAISNRAGSPGPVATVPAFDRLHLDYHISGDRPAWRPLRAFDDGRQTYIQFPDHVAQGAVPPLFVIGESGKPELVNYRMIGRYYLVDRIFDVAELRLGDKRQDIVRIKRSRAPTGRGGGKGT